MCLGLYNINPMLPVTSQEIKVPGSNEKNVDFNTDGNFPFSSWILLCVCFFCLCLFVLVGKAASTQGKWCSEPFNSTASQALIVHIRKGKRKWGVRTCCLKPRKMLESQMWEPPTLPGDQWVPGDCQELAYLLSHHRDTLVWHSVSEQLLVPTSTLF